MICELFLSEELTGLHSSEVNSAVQFLKKIFGKLNLDENAVESVIALTMQDKKNERGELRFSLLSKIGEAMFNVPVLSEQAKKALLRYCKI